MKFVHFVANITNFGGLHGKRELQRKTSPRIGDRFSLYRHAKNIKGVRLNAQNVGLMDFVALLSATKRLHLINSSASTTQAWAGDRL